MGGVLGSFFEHTAAGGREGLRCGSHFLFFSRERSAHNTVDMKDVAR